MTTYPPRALELLDLAADDRAAGDHVAAGDKEKDAAALIRMAQAQELVAAGSHEYHPLTGRLVPRR